MYSSLSTIARDVLTRLAMLGQCPQFLPIQIQMLNDVLFFKAFPNRASALMSAQNQRSTHNIIIPSSQWQPSYGPAASILPRVKFSLCISKAHHQTVHNGIDMVTCMSCVTALRLEITSISTTVHHVQLEAKPRDASGRSRSTFALPRTFWGLTGCPKNRTMKP